MKLLILGGTLFLGRYLTEAAQARGHEVTLFNRGQTNAGLFPDIETLRGDREQSLEPLRGRQWDAGYRHLRLCTARRGQRGALSMRLRRALHFHIERECVPQS
jgi:nucleoside-diphosphate-sugar epimerase